MFLDISINSVYGVITSYLEWRENFLNTYSNLFDEPITEEDLSEVEPEDRKELEAEMRLSKWAWEKTIYILANEDITNIAKAKALLSNPGTSVSGGSSGGGASSSSAQAVQPQFSMFGSAGNANTINASGQSNNQNITVTAVVSETEITSTQNNINKIKESASL